MNPHQEERGKKKRKKKKNSLHSLRSFVNSFFFISPHSPKSIFYFQPNDKLLAIITCPLDFFPKFYRTFPSPCPRKQYLKHPGLLCSHRPHTPPLSCPLGNPFPRRGHCNCGPHR